MILGCVATVAIVFVMMVSGPALFNPEITLIKGEPVEDWEGCLSVPGIRGVVPRAREVSVSALDRMRDCRSLTFVRETHSPGPAF